jgi:5-methylcytosine-specific restriction endonuclease McrA
MIKKITPDMEQKIIALYLSGKTQKNTASECNVSETFVYNILKRNNIKTRTNSEAHMGHRHSEEWKQNHSKRMKEHKHPGWKGGCKEYWSKECKIRDDYICQICGHREPEIMVADHIKPKSVYPEFSCDINNLITLCPNCHARKTIREKKNKEYTKEE